MGKEQKKTYVLDTTVLIFDPNVFFKTGEADWVIPLAVIREIDGLKSSDKDLVAKATRQLARTLDRLGSYGDLAAGVKLSTGRILRVYSKYEIVSGLASEADNKIVGAALSLKNAGEDVTLFTTDTNMRTVARVYGVKAEYTPFFDIEIPSQVATAERNDDNKKIQGGGVLPLSKRRGPLFSKRKVLKTVYQSLIVLLILFGVIAICGVFGSLAGYKGPLWKIAEVFGYIGVVLLIISIILYSSVKDGLRFKPDPCDTVTNPIFSNLTGNIFHDD